MIPILLFTVLSLGSIHADILNDVILTPFSWTDNEVENKVKENKAMSINGTTAKSWTIDGKAVITREFMETIKAKYKSNKDEAFLKNRFRVIVLER